MRFTGPLVIVATNIFVCGTALADSDAFLKAATFALTGSDGAPVHIVDRDRCVFSIDYPSLSEIYFLNNVNPSRIAYKRGSSMSKAGDISRFIEVGLFGEDTVYEAHPHAAGGGSSPTELRGTSRNIRLETDEFDRVQRAWKYLYSHGCKGAASSF